MRQLGPTICVLLAALAAGMLGACSGRGAERQLREAEARMIAEPDSTVAMLVGMDTTRMTERQKHRRELLYLYTNLVYGYPIPLDSTAIAEGDKVFSKGFDTEEIRWLILKSNEAKNAGNPVARIELLKDAEFLAIRLNDRTDLGIAYLLLSNVYEQGFNGTVSKHYADMALAIFRELEWPTKVCDARMAAVGAYAAKRDYRPMLDSLIAMQPEVMANATEGYKTFYLDQLARAYDMADQHRKAISIWHSIYDGKQPSPNALAHWAHAYCHTGQLDSAYLLIQQANLQPRNTTDQALCLNVEHDILEKMGRREELAHVDSLRDIAAMKAVQERQLEASSLALNVKYDSAARNAWIEAADARHRTNAAILITLAVALVAIAGWIYLRKRNQLLSLQHENDILRIRAMQENLFESDSRSKEMSARIAQLFQTRFNLLDSLAATYFECRDTRQEQKRIHSDVKEALANFATKEATQDLTDIVDGYKGNLMADFRKDFPKMSASQSRLALYLFCGFSLPSISIFTGTELKNIYVYKSRLKSAIAKSEAARKEEYLSYFE